MWFSPSGRSRGALGGKEKPLEVKIAQAVAVNLWGALGSLEVSVTSPRAEKPSGSLGSFMS